MSDPMLFVDPKLRQEVFHIRSLVVGAIPTDVSYAAIVLALSGLIQTYTETWLTDDDDDDDGDGDEADWLEATDEN